MSMNARSGPGTLSPPQGTEIASYATYAEAEKAVDTLADGSFQVQAVTIVGSDLRMVEKVVGRLTYPRVALAGAASGAWFGLFVGIIFSMFNAEDLIATIALAMLVGAAFGMLFGVMSFAFTGGRRDFTTKSQVVASRYAVLCRSELADEARSRLLQAGLASRVPPTPTAGASDLPPVPGANTNQYPPQRPVRSAPTPPAGPPRFGQRRDDSTQAAQPQASPPQPSQSQPGQSTTEDQADRGPSDR